MSLPILLLILFAFLLVGLLTWALRAQDRPARPAVDVFEALSRPRHCSRMSHVLQALQPQDTEFLRETGQLELMQTLRRQRRRIAVNYLDQLQAEFEELLEISRVLTVMAPQATGMQEMNRWKLGVSFAANCALLRWKLRLGLEPFTGFTLLSNIATDFARELEMATARIAEAAMHGSKSSAPDNQKIGGP